MTMVCRIPRVVDEPEFVVSKRPFGRLIRNARIGGVVDVEIDRAIDHNGDVILAQKTLVHCRVSIADE